MLQPHPTRRRRRGAAAVEFAAVAVVFFTLILALFELGRGLMCDYILANAAREACRAGVVPSATTDTITQAANTSLSGSKLSGATVTVQVNGTSADASTAQTGDRITVKITVPVASVTWVPLTRYLSGSLTGQYTLKRE
jgi:Flp pilus assembly protein TadG